MPWLIMGDLNDVIDETKKLEEEPSGIANCFFGNSFRRWEQWIWSLKEQDLLGIMSIWGTLLSRRDLIKD